MQPARCSDDIVLTRHARDTHDTHFPRFSPHVSGGLIGKPAATFFSTGTQGGGQETTALTFVTQLAHHGMVYVPLGYSHPKRTDMSEIIGGSPCTCARHM